MISLPITFCISEKFSLNIFSTSCSSTISTCAPESKASKIVEPAFLSANLLLSSRIPKPDNLADLEEDVTKEDWHGFLTIVDGWGPQSNRKKKSGFSKKTNDGVTTVKLSYTFEIAEIGLVYERIVLINRGEDYKIRTVIMNSDEEVVIEATKDF